MAAETAAGLTFETMSEMNKRSMDADDVFLAVLRPEEEREKSLAAAKAALTAEKWSAVEGESLNMRARKMLAASAREIVGERKEVWP